MEIEYVGPIRDAASATLPLTAAEIRPQARIDSTDDDTLLTGYIEAATEMVEKFIGKSLMETEWKLWLNGGFPRCGKSIVISHAPVTSIDGIYYVDLDGTEQELESYQEQLEGSSPQILPAYQETWPDTRCVLKAVRIEFTAGYGTVPKSALQAIRMICAEFYKNREIFNPEMKMENLQSFPILSILLSPLRAVRFIAF